MRKNFIGVCNMACCLVAAAFAASCADSAKEMSANDWETRVIEAWFQTNYPDNWLNKMNGGLPDCGYILESPTYGSPNPKDGEYVLYDLSGRLLDGTKFRVTKLSEAEVLFFPSATFYSTHYAPILDSIGSATIPSGVTEMLKLMTEGDSVTLLLPSICAYGEKGYSLTGYPAAVPANTPVIFDLMLRKIIPNHKEYEEDLVNDFVTKNNNSASNRPFVRIEDTLGTYEEGGKKYLNNIWVKYIDTIKVTDSTPLPQNDTVMGLKYAGYLLDGFVFDTNIDTIAKKQLRAFFTSQSKYFTTFSYTMGDGTTITAFDAALRRLNRGSRMEFVFTSDWGYGRAGTSGIPNYTPLRFVVYREK